MVTETTTPKSAKKQTDAGRAARRATAAEGAESADPSTETKALKIKDIVDRVMLASGVTNRKNVRQVVEASLSELVKSLQAGEQVNLPSLGRLRVANQREDDTGLHMTLKLRRPLPKAEGENSAKEALAADGEDS